MPLDLVSLGIGFGSGVAATAVALNLMQRTTVRNPEQTKLTASWALSEIARGGPVAVMAERFDGLELPPKSKVLVPHEAVATLPEVVLRTCEVRTHSDVHANTVIARETAVVFSSQIHPLAAVVFTREEAAVKKLQSEFTRLWTSAEPHYNQVRVEEALGREGHLVEILGTAAEMMEFRGRRMLRVQENKSSIGVVVEDPQVAALQGRPVRVAGRVVSEGGQVFLEARRVEGVSPRAMAAVARTG